MNKEETTRPAPRLTAIQWVICIIASIGFAFDTYELLVLPLIVRPALTELGQLQFGSPAFGHWRDLLFYVPAMAGGIFGLLGGYLTDRLGRRRILVWSIILYAFSALAAGFTTSLPWLLFFRCTTFIGGLVGRLVLAFLAIRILSRRNLLRVFQVPGLIIVPLVFLWPAVHSLPLLKWGIFLAGFFTVAQFSFWGNYLPRVYPTHLRGTGESFAANIGGRMIGTSAALLTTQLASRMPGGNSATQLAYAAAAVALLVYAIGLTLSFRLPEPKQEALPE
jgi:MFS family permease